MNSTNPFLAALLVAGLALAAPAQDEVHLSDSQVLTGEVTRIGPDGRVLLKSGISTEPLEIKAEAAQKVTFEASEATGEPHSEILHLTNGDTLPGVFAALDAENIGFETSYTGRLTVPRNMAKAIDFGVAPQRLVFEGPGKSSDWENNNDWKWDGASISSSTNDGSISRPDVLPEQFILRFRIEWVGSPSLRFYFCDDALKADAETDRYYFEFNSAGIQLKRETSEDGRRWHHLVSLPIKPRSFPAAKMDVELRVDRFQRIIHLYINNESQGSYRDPIGDFPDGTGILIESNAGGGSKNILSRIQIFEWDAVSQLRREEGHEDTSLDALISTDGNRFSGTAKMLVAEDGQTEVLFRSPHADEDLPVPRERISSLYFRVAESTTSAPPTHVADLRKGGRLRLSNPTLTDGVLQALHPLLGEITVDQDALVVLERLPGQKD